MVQVVNVIQMVRVAWVVRVIQVVLGAVFCLLSSLIGRIRNKDSNGNHLVIGEAPRANSLSCFDNNLDKKITIQEF